MRICAIRNSEETVLSTLKAARAYAEEHGLRYDEKHYMVTDANDNPKIYFLPQGRKFFLVLGENDFNCPELLTPIGNMHLRIRSADAVIKVLRQRSDVDISCAKNGRYFLHEGAIMAVLTGDNVEIGWYADPGNGVSVEDVTKHVASILGLLKGCLG